MTDKPAPTRRCRRCGNTRPLTRYDVCAQCTAEMGWDPPCQACHDEGTGIEPATGHVDTCAGAGDNGPLAKERTASASALDAMPLAHLIDHYAALSWAPRNGDDPNSETSADTIAEIGRRLHAIDRLLGEYRGSKALREGVRAAVYGSRPTPGALSAPVASSTRLSGEHGRVGTNSGHGYAWDRPDGWRATCGGPGMCDDCEHDQQLEIAAAEARGEDPWQ